MFSFAYITWKANLGQRWLATAFILTLNLVLTDNASQILQLMHVKKTI